MPFILSTASTRSIEAVAKANGDGHRWYQLYWYAFSLYLAQNIRHLTCPYNCRPRSNEVTLSLLGRAKGAGFTALVVTLDAFVIGWRPHDLDTAYLHFATRVNTQVGRSDPVFMQRMGVAVQPDERPPFPFDLDAFRERVAAGDEQAIETLRIGAAWRRETKSGTFRRWEDLKFLRENWDGPLGIQPKTRMRPWTRRVLPQCI